MNKKTLMASQNSQGPDLLLKIVFIFCLFSFKINIVGIGEGGVRIDDVVMSIGFIYILINIISNDEKFPNYITVYVVFVLYSILMSVISGLEARINPYYGILFSLRLLQYLIFFFVGTYLGRREFEIDLILKSYVVYSLIIIFGQKLGLIPALNQFGIERVSGNTNGPYELAAICSFLIFYFQNNKKISKWYTLYSFIILWMTASRITTFAVVVLFVQFHWSYFKEKLFRIISIIVLLIAVGALFNFGSDTSSVDKSESTGLVDRITSIDVLGFVNAAVSFYDQTNIYKSSDEYLDDAYLNSLEVADSDPDMDASGVIRFTRWAALFKSMFSTVSTTLFGLGPSFGSIAVDGYITRLLVETGVFGFLIFSFFSIFILTSLDERKKWIGYYFGTLLISSFFIDILMSYKPMILFWFALGLEYSKGKP